MQCAWMLAVYSFVTLGAFVDWSWSAEAYSGHGDPPVVQSDDGVIHVGNMTFDSWAEFFDSDVFKSKGMRCGSTFLDGVLDPADAPSDCSYNNTNPLDSYAPVTPYRIPVVVHVLRNSNGTLGDISESMVESQIRILNEDFLALAGTNGGQGTDIQVEFFLATLDPNGQPTNGITYSNNTTWYNDSGTYYNELAWDPNRFLNIYTNTAGGYLGYVPFLPQNGAVGSKADRVVINWTAFGDNSPGGPPYHKGRTATHEVGHYLGLFHTFDNGCGSATACYTSGDRICDTQPEGSPAFGCPTGRTTCSDPDPVRNYMDYSDDLCMTNFTPEQARRMRCTMQWYRPDVFQAGDTLMLASTALTRGQNTTLTATGADQGDEVYFFYSFAGEGSTDIPFLGISLGIDNAVEAGSSIADATGTATLVRRIPANAPRRLIWLQAAKTGLVSNIILTQIN